MGLMDVENQASIATPGSRGDARSEGAQLHAPSLKRVHELRGEVAVLRERLAAAELIVEEREQRIRDLRGALRIISAGILQAGASGQLAGNPGVWKNQALPAARPAPRPREASAAEVEGLPSMVDSLPRVEANGNDRPSEHGPVSGRRLGWVTSLRQGLAEWRMRGSDED
jgi:hypothetical protein